MSNVTGIFPNDLGFTARHVLMTQDACLITKDGKGRFNLQGLNEALEVPKEVPVYAVNEVHSTKFPTCPPRYNVTRTYKGKPQFAAGFKSKEDADAYTKQKNAAAASEVADRYKLEQVSATWIYVRDTSDKGLISSVVAKFSTKHEAMAREFLKRMNAE